jgi:uncharacterized protein
VNEILSLIAAQRKPVIGMVQLGARPSGSRYRGGTIAPLLDAALEEAEILGKNGVDALMVQNLGDIPVAHRVTRVQVAWMTRIASEVRGAARLPVGVNFLENDARRWSRSPRERAPISCASRSLSARW